jgi:hypothetical protein
MSYMYIGGLFSRMSSFIVVLFCVYVIRKCKYNTRKYGCKHTVSYIMSKRVLQMSKRSETLRCNNGKFRLLITEKRFLQEKKKRIFKYCIGKITHSWNFCFICGLNTPTVLRNREHLFIKMKSVLLSDSNLQI